MASVTKDPLILRDKILKSLGKNEINRALSLGRDMLKLPRASVDDCVSVSEMGQRYGDVQTAVMGARAACRKEPQSLAVLFQLADVERRGNLIEDAFESLNNAKELCRSAGDYAILGSRWWRLDEAHLAHDAFLQAYEISPDSADVLSDLAGSFGYLGQMEEAEKFYDLAISKGARRATTFYQRTWLRRQTQDRNHIEELKSLIDGWPGDKRELPYLQFSLAKELEDVGKNDQVFDVLEAAAQGRRKHLDYSLEKDIEGIEAVMTAYSEAAFEGRREEHDSNEPIFVLGLPRSGSTLMERIISNHSKVFSAGELINLNRVVGIMSGALARKKGTSPGNPLVMALDTNLRDVGKSYIASTRPRTGHTAHFIDKRPTNAILCGVIGLALPNAKIVHTWRNPMDACFSMFKQCFGSGYGYSYDQKELGTYYIAYRRLMDHWDKVMPGKIIHVKYEDVVADTEAVSRDLIQRLGLEWEDACLDHTANKEASMTASATQVRQPIYKSSVEKWRQFEDRLGVLKQTLEDGGIDVG